MWTKTTKLAVNVAHVTISPNTIHAMHADTFQETKDGNNFQKSPHGTNNGTAFQEYERPQNILPTVDVLSRNGLPTNAPPILIKCDNQSAIQLAKDDRFHARTKHIDIRFHFIRYAIENQYIELAYCPTNDMTADIFTKPLPSLKVKHFASAMGLANV